MEKTKVNDWISIATFGGVLLSIILLLEAGLIGVLFALFLLSHVWEL
ncbi:hypothetical protein R4Z10_06185 [Niallia sp. XMNu-256]